MSSEKAKHMDAGEVIHRYYEGEETGEEGAFPENTLASVPTTHPQASSEGGADITPSGGDMDSTQTGTDAGEEAVGGSNPTPDQDVVDELGKAVGITYEDNEPLRFGDKVADRDARRWELNPASSEGYQDRLRELSGAGEDSAEEPIAAERSTRKEKAFKGVAQPETRKTVSRTNSPKKKR